MVERQVVIRNKLGLHARASARFVTTANGFSSNVYLIKDGIEVNGKSIMGIMMLAAGKDSEICIRTDGADEEDMLETLETLVNDRFGENE